MMLKEVTDNTQIPNDSSQLPIMAGLLHHSYAGYYPLSKIY